MPAPELGTVANTTLIFCPGALNGLLPVRAFSEGLPAIEQRYGCRVLRAEAHPMRGVEANVDDLEKAIDHGIGLDADLEPIPAERAEPPSDLFLIGYSKGAPDALALLVRRPELKKRVRCLFLWAGAAGGSPIADGAHRKFEKLRVGKAEDRLRKHFAPLLPRLDLKGPLSRLGEADLSDMVEDLTTEKRQAFLESHKDLLDAMDIPTFTFAGSTTAREVPWFQLSEYLKLRRLEPHTDMQLLASSTRIPIPMATELALVHGHHWDLSYGPFPKIMRAGSRRLRHPFPKSAAVVSMVQLAAELGLID